MTSWNLKTIEELFDSILNRGNSSDPKEQKKQKIVAAAATLFERHGYRKTSIDDVAREAGIAKGTVYLYFKTKGDLMVHVIVEEKKRYMKHMRPIFNETNPKERLRQWIIAVFAVGSKMPITSRLLKGDQEIQQVLSEMNPETRDKSEELTRSFLNPLLDEAAAPHRWTAKELSDRVSVLQGLAYFSGLLTDETVRRGLSADRFAHILADMLVDGIAPTPYEHHHSQKQKGDDV